MRSRPRMLVLQARWPDDPMREHERQCFVRATGLPDDHVVTHNLCKSTPTFRTITSYDALSVGGSGDFYVSKSDLPGFEAVLDLLRDVVEAGRPTFASCFGYQLMVQALGGEITHDPGQTEVGSFELSLTEAGRADELTSSLPERFVAQLGHKDRAVRHPDGIPNLASSERSPFQALRIPGRPIWASQFHPELDRHSNLVRFRHYLSNYSTARNEEELEAMFAAYRDSPETSGLLRRFVDLVFD